MERSSPSSLAAPPRSFHDHDPSLDSSSTSPTHFCQRCPQSCHEHHNDVDPSRVETNNIGTTQEYNHSIYPSLSQQAALATLQGFENEVVIAWLTVLRSFRLDGNHWFQPGSLSTQQFEAISVLQGCPDGLVSSWLDLSRGGAFDGLQHLYGLSDRGTQRASAALLHNSWQASSSTARSSAGSFGAVPSLYDGYTTPTTPTSSRSRGTFLDVSREPSIDETTQSFTIGHSHWCFICEHPRVITTCDGWKRHMKEHETRYRCMPRGPIEYTTDGAKCAFCGFRDPDQGHCDTHKVYPCANKSLDVRSYTRKSHLLAHLKTHHTSDRAELVDYWRDTINKRHFSCGFCVSHFHSLIEQLNHIDVVHYRLFQHIRDWNSNNVIRGLLLRPGVDDSWRRILASRPGLKDSLFRWDSSVIRNLQSRLEMSDETADTLAEVAFNESTYDWSHHGEAETTDATRLSYHGGVAAPQQNAVTAAAAPVHFDSSESSATDVHTTSSSASQREQFGWPWAVPDIPMSYRNNLQTRVDSNVPEENVMMGMQHPYQTNNQRLSTTGGNHRTHLQPSSYASWTSSNILDSQPATTNSVMPGDCWQPTPILNPTNSSSLISSQYGPQNHHTLGRARAMVATQNTFPPSTLTTSPASTRTAIPFAKPSPAGRPRKRPSRSKLKDHYDINTEADMDLDLDVLQHLMRDEEGTRSERRRR